MRSPTGNEVQMKAYYEVQTLDEAQRRELSMVMSVEMDHLVGPDGWTFDGDTIQEDWWGFRLIIENVEPERNARWTAGCATQAMAVLLAAATEHPDVRVITWPHFTDHYLCAMRGGDARDLPRPRLAWKPDLA